MLTIIFILVLINYRILLRIMSGLKDASTLLFLVHHMDVMMEQFTGLIRKPLPNLSRR
jgi:hypothetical protein